MHSIHDIALLLNDSLKELFKSKCLANSVLYGIAESVRREQSLLPEIDEKYVGLSDEYAASLYHKIISLQTSVKPGTGVGRSVGYQSNIYAMSLVIFNNRARTGLYPDELLLSIQANFPERLNLDPYRDIVVVFSGSILNSQTIYREEYESNTYKLNLNQYLFKINYTIETVHDKRCFLKCY